MKKELNLNELNTISGGNKALAFNSHPIHERTAKNNSTNSIFILILEITPDKSVVTPILSPRINSDLMPNNIHKRFVHSKPQIKPCTFEGNHAPSSGGALNFD